MQERREINELLDIPREKLSEVTFTLRDPEIETEPGTDILERIRSVPHERFTQLSTVLRDVVDPFADGWSDHYSQKDPNGWRDSWKDKKGIEIPLDRTPPTFRAELRGPSFGPRPRP